MNDKKSAKSKIWIYAVVLFTSAFIVLMLTAYSQIRLNNNLSNYKDKISNTESEKTKFQLSFSSAQETNTKLQENIAKLEADNKTLSEKYNELANEKAKSDENYKNALQEYNELSAAQVLFLNENYIDASLILSKDIDISLLDPKTKELYTTLLAKATSKAGNLLYEQGLELSKKRDYTAAIQKFSQALEIAPGDQASDSWLYNLGLACSKTDNEEKALESMGKLIAQYPESSYYKKAKSYYDRHIK